MPALRTRPTLARACPRAWVLLATALPTLTSAQQPTAASDELSQAILRYAFRGDGGNVRLIPGRVPDDLAPNFHAPAGTRVLGTVVMGSGALVLAATNVSPDSLRAEYTRALAPRGWKPMEERRRSGFIPSGAELPLVFCRDGATLYVRYSRRSTAPHDLHLDYRDGGMCETPAAERVQSVRMGEPTFPTLYDPAPPAGMSTSRCYSRAGGRSMGALGPMTIVASNLSATDILRHYARQLEAAGWRAPGPSATPPIVSGSWLRSDSTGTAQVTLEVTEGSPASGCYQVRMSLTGGPASR
ncbi:MAG: hypothetical protein ABR499_16635 [Gemmatimonadaceae bacterium]